MRPRPRVGDERNERKVNPVERPNDDSSVTPAPERRERPMPRPEVRDERAKPAAERERPAPEVYRPRPEVRDVERKAPREERRPEPRPERAAPPREERSAPREERQAQYVERGYVRRDVGHGAFLYDVSERQTLSPQTG